MISSKIIINASADKIWQVITDKSQMKEWYFDIPDFELKEGATFNFYEPGGKNEFHHQCTIKEIIPSKKLSYTWTHPEMSKGESTVTWELNEDTGKTEVNLQHDGIENFADAGEAFAPENYQKGWDGFLSILKNYINGIRKHSFTISIQATKDKVWRVLWSKDTYMQWAAIFHEGSYYDGELKQDGRVHFLSPEKDGMFSDVYVYSPPNNIMFQHKGGVKGGEEQPINEETEQWNGVFENYILTENEGNTLLKVEIDLPPDHSEYFSETFPKAMQIIKELSENKI